MNQIYIKAPSSCNMFEGACTNANSIAQILEKNGINEISTNLKEINIDNFDEKDMF